LFNNNLKITNMKKIIIVLISVVYLFCLNVNGQGVVIGTNSGSADPAAILDLQDTNKGFLLTRLTTEERNAINAPPQGLIIFNTTVGCVQVFDGTNWGCLDGTNVEVPPCNAPNTPTLAIHTPSETQIIWNWNSVAGADGYKYNTVNNSTTATDIGTNTTYTQGGLSICTEYSIYVWAYNNCDNSSVLTLTETTTGLSPTTPTAGTHTPSQTQIVWNWNSVAGASGYKFNTVNNYASATDNGTNTTYTQGSLTCDTEYNLYVWTYNACGNSSVLTLTQTTASCPVCDVSSVTFTYKGEEVTYGTVESSGKCWMDRNLGATAVATSSTHAASYGDLFQWGRRDDGHQNRNSSTSWVQSSIDQPLHDNFITNFTDWRNPSNNNLWQGVDGINNPCPSGWRVPTSTEWNAELATWGLSYLINATNAINSPLKLPLAGSRAGNNANLENVNFAAYYWAGNPNGGMSIIIFINNSSAQQNFVNRSFGYSVRCIKD